MTQDEIIEMAREAGLSNPLWIENDYKIIETFASLVEAKVTAKEREACAKVCEQSEIPIPIDVWLESTKKEISKHTALALAAAIRTRGEQA